jgi:hypothetical protein
MYGVKLIGLTNQTATRVGLTVVLACLVLGVRAVLITLAAAASRKHLNERLMFWTRQASSLVAFAIMVLVTPGMWVRARQFSGRVVTITNDKVFDEPIYNFTRELPFIWEEIGVGVSYDADHRRAARIEIASATFAIVGLPPLRITRDPHRGD